ncbi:hypothetical protein MTO96_021990 [Rhipicephalus appendiculatus]
MKVVNACRAQQHQRGGSPERSAFFGPIKQDAAVPAEQRNYAFFRCFKRLDDCVTLKSRCLRKVVLLIMTARKPPDDLACPPELNPFISFPSELVEDLIETVIQMSPRARDKITPDVRADDLSQLLVRSGRVRCFSLWDVEMHSRDFSAALRQLSDTGAAAMLQELEIDGVYVRGRRPEYILRSLDNVGRLLRAAPKLRALRLGLSGRSLLDLAALENLEELSLTYDCHRELDDIIGQAEKTGDPLWPRLRCFSYGDYFSSASRRTVSYLLCHCTQLVELRADVSRALLDLHEQQFLQEGGPSLQIATVACPNLVDVDVYVDCHESVLALAEFSHLRYLKLMWVSSKLAGCFETSTLSLLHEVGCQLVELCLHSFVKVDLNAVAFLCPSLEAFGLIQCRTVANHVPVSQPFAGLTKVRVIPPPDYPAIQAEDDLCCVLSSCSDTQVLRRRPRGRRLRAPGRPPPAGDQQRLSLCRAGRPLLPTAHYDARSAGRYLVVADTELGDLAKQVNPRLKIRFEYLYVGL